jgi:AcrR family transcriptional regulator
VATPSRLSSTAPGATRQQMLDAAIDTILERGYYRASSNEIARRAGVTWGVIQHHFKSRERLMLATLEEEMVAYEQRIAAASISGDTLAERLVSLGVIVAEHYAHERYLADLQIVVNLMHDPDTERATIEAMEAASERIATGLTRLLDDAAAPIELTAADRRLIFAGLRGVALHELLWRTYYPRVPVEPGQLERTMRSMADALALQLTTPHD